MKGARTGDPKPRSSATGVSTRERRRRGAPVERFDHEIGEHLGLALTVTRQISAGPFTEIYQVWCAERMSFFALKLLRAGVANGSAERRHITHEQAVLRRLAHPHIVRLYDADPGLSRTHVLMDHLPGPSLLERISAAPRRRLPVVEAVTTAIQIASAIGHLHERGYLYRDLKPANVLEGQNGSVLIDFGSVFRWRPGRVPRERLGTDPYMAPEQCLGEPLGPATDVYGIGAVLHEALTGEWAFEDQLMNVFDRTRLENRFPQIAHEVRPLRKRAAAVPAGLDEVVRRCLARNPSDRYQSAAELVNELLAYADGLGDVIPGAAA